MTLTCLKSLRHSEVSNPTMLDPATRYLMRQEIIRRKGASYRSLNGYDFSGLPLNSIILPYSAQFPALEGSGGTDWRGKSIHKLSALLGWDVDFDSCRIHPNQQSQFIVVWLDSVVKYLPPTAKGDRHWEGYSRAWSLVHLWNELLLSIRARHLRMDIDQYYQKYRPDISMVDTSGLVRHWRMNQLLKTVDEMVGRGRLDGHGNPW